MMEKINILHLCTDEKFIDRAVNIFEIAFPEQNSLCVYNKGKPIVHIKRPVDICVGAKESLLGVNFSDIGHFDIVVVHALAKIWYRTIERLDKNIPIVWLGWGYDYYDLIGGDEKWLLQDTYSFYKEESQKRNLTQILKDAILYPRWRQSRVIEKIQYFSPVLQDEYQTLRNCRAWKSFPEQVDWNYSPAEKDLSYYVSSSDDVGAIGNNVLVGNSATNTNNHLEIFRTLRNINLQGRKFIIPLNYGNKIYGEKIGRMANELLGEHADVLLKFMPIDDYMNKISSCGFVIMNHVRQQGVGNIISMLYMGAKVFIREENPTFIYLKRNGVTVFSVQELENNPQLLFSPLSQLEVVNNRTIVESLWSNSTLLKKTKKIIYTLMNK